MLKPYPQDVMEACFNAAKETYAEIGATNAPFKKIHDSMMAYRADAYLWQQVSENTFDTFMMKPAAQEAAVITTNRHPGESRDLAAGRFRLTPE